MLDKKKLKTTCCLMAINHTLEGQLVSVLSCKVFLGGGEWVIASFLVSSELLQNFFQLRNLGFASARKVDVPILLCIIGLNNAE